MEYNFREIETRWQNAWREDNTYKVEEDGSRPKFYVLDMFPYPSGAGLHVGHPLGYIASDIYARFKRHKGFNVLHPMGYDAFGLPAEQYAIQTGQHPAVTTVQNIERYRSQLDRIGFSYDWSREIRTCDASYYKWTQWIFLKLFNAWYNKQSNKAEPIESLIAEFNKNGNLLVEAVCGETEHFNASSWKSFPEAKQQQILLQYRLAFLSEAVVLLMLNVCSKDWIVSNGLTPLRRHNAIGSVGRKGPWSSSKRLTKTASISSRFLPHGQIPFLASHS